VGFIINEALILAMALSIGSPLSLSVGLLTMIAFPMQYLLIFFYKAEIVKENAPITIGSGSLINKIKYLYGSTFFQFTVAIGCFFNKLLWVLIFFAVIGNLFWMGTLFVQYINLKRKF
jgi:hypothetical protein